MKKVLFAMAIVGMFGFAACKSNTQKVEDPIEDAAECVENAASDCCNKTEETIENAVEEVVDAAADAVNDLVEEVAAQ